MRWWSIVRSSFDYLNRLYRNFLHSMNLTRFLFKWFTNMLRYSCHLLGWLREREIEKTVIWVLLALKHLGIFVHNFITRTTSHFNFQLTSLNPVFPNFCVPPKHSVKLPIFKMLLSPRHVKKLWVRPCWNKRSHLNNMILKTVKVEMLSPTDKVGFVLPKEHPTFS